MFEEGGGVGDLSIEAVAFAGVIGWREGLAVALDEAGDGAVAGLDDFAQGIALGVDLVLTVANGDAALAFDDGDFIGDGCLCPRARRAVGEDGGGL